MSEHLTEITQIQIHAFGMTHPSWKGPECFFYDSVDQAQAAIVKVYGPGTQHGVAERRLRKPPPGQLT